MVGQQIRRMFGLPVGDGAEGDDGDDGEGRETDGMDFIREYDLTEVDWTDQWERIYIDEQDKDKIVNYGLLEQQLQASTFDQMTLSRHGAVLLSGPPGTGKTTLAKGAANELAKHLDRDRLGVEDVIFKTDRGPPPLLERSRGQPQTRRAGVRFGHRRLRGRRRLPDRPARRGRIPLRTAGTSPIPIRWTRSGR